MPRHRLPFVLQEIISIAEYICAAFDFVAALCLVRSIAGRTHSAAQTGRHTIIGASIRRSSRYFIGVRFVRRWCAVAKAVFVIEIETSAGRN